MADKQYRVAGPFPAYGAKVGDVVTLDADDPLVQINVSAGIIAPAKSTVKAADPMMTCPLCVERGMTKPVTVTSADDLAKHYADKHAGFVVPPFVPNVEKE